MNNLASADMLITDRTMEAVHTHRERERERETARREVENERCLQKHTETERKE